MQGQLAVLLLGLGLAVAEPPAPYRASGWRPNGPAFELPQKFGTQNNQQQSYLPPIEPRRPQTQYGAPDDDDTITVQGLPVKEEVPIFMISPINGQQYVGPNFNSDINNLIQRLKQSQFQTQQELFRKLEQELYATQNQQKNNAPNQQEPRQFGYNPTYPTTESTTFASTQDDSADTATETVTEISSPTQLGKTQKQNILSLEITKERLRELPVIFLGPIAQNAQVNRGFARLTQPQGANFGYNGPAHLAGLQSILSQRQQAITSPKLEDDSLVEQITPTEQKSVIPQAYNPAVQPVLVQLQPTQFGQSDQRQFVQIPQAFLNQPQYVRQPQDLNEQFVVNPQPVQIPQLQQAFLNQPQYSNLQNPNTQQLILNPQFPQQFLSPQLPNQGQYYQNQVQAQNPNALQSGLEMEQEGNGIEDKEGSGEEDESTANPTSTAFGTRTSPRVYAQYGVPVSRPTPSEVQEPVTESMNSAEETEEPIVATATAIANGSKRRSSKLR